MTPEEVYHELLDHGECVLATSSSDGKPEAATVFYAVADDGSLHISTFTSYRKYKNLIDNPRVSVVVTVDVRSVQIDGVAEELSGEEAIRSQRLQDAKHGMMSKYAEDPRTRYFHIRPAWVRVYVDHGHHVLFGEDK